MKKLIVVEGDGLDEDVVTVALYWTLNRSV